MAGLYLSIRLAKTVDGTITWKTRPNFNRCVICFTSLMQVYYDVPVASRLIITLKRSSVIRSISKLVSHQTKQSVDSHQVNYSVIKLIKHTAIILRLIQLVVDLGIH